MMGARFLTGKFTDCQKNEWMNKRQNESYGED